MSELNVYKAADLPVQEVKFCAWKIREGSKVSKGSLLFTFEYKSLSDGQVKSEKLKCKLNGITVLKLYPKSQGEIINSDTELFTYEKCSHPIKLNEMCGVCGEDLRKEDERRTLKPANANHSSKSNNGLKASAQSTAAGGYIPMLHAEPHIKVDMSEALELGKRDLLKLVKSRKLVLLVDLDHTLIHTTNEHVSASLKDVYHYELQHRHVWYHTKFRPGTMHFLDVMSKLYELHVVTFGERMYAHKIADLMDPQRKYFHDRILSRNEIFNPVSKTDNLKALFPRGDLMVCIIDDREDVWNYARNLVCVKPYVYFKNTGDINDPSLINMKNRKRKLCNVQANDREEQIDASRSIEEECVSEELSDKDDYLNYLEIILRKVHDEYYSLYEQKAKTHESISKNEIDESDLPDVKKVLPMLKSRVLENCVLTFSGVVPTGFELRKQRCYMIAAALGAKVNEHLLVYGVEENEPEQIPSHEQIDEAENSSNSSNISVHRSNEQRKVYTTHLVAAKYGTCKVHEALKSQKRPIHVVTPEWLLDCNFKWEKCDENAYKLSKDYDYKTCVFHQEYNNQQKYQARFVQHQQQQQADFVQTKRAKSEIKAGEKNQADGELEKKAVKLNEDIFEAMDKEVSEELDEDEDEEEMLNEQTDLEEEEEQENSFTSSSSSFDNHIINDDDDDDDDELALALERDLVNKK